jgi:hypothetical protein
MQKRFFSILVLAACSMAAAHAEVVVLLDTPDQTAVPGTTLQYFGTITNSDPTNAVYLNGDSLTLSAPDGDFTVNDLFFSNVPISLDGGANSGDIELFDVTINDPFTDPYAVYTGAYELLGGVDGNAQDVLAANEFSAAPLAPEPVTSVLTLSGLAALAVIRRRKTSL